jgi:hypothetical protein
MKKALKVVGMAVALTALPVAFTGGASGDSLGVRISGVCADEGHCEFEIGSVCRVNGEEILHHTKMGPEGVD